MALSRIPTVLEWNSCFCRIRMDMEDHGGTQATLQKCSVIVGPMWGGEHENISSDPIQANSHPILS